MQGNALRIFVVEKDSFIARDMQIGLQQACPGGDVHCLRSLKDLRPVLDVLPPSSALPVFITRLALQRLRESGLICFPSGSAASSFRAAMSFRQMKLRKTIFCICPIRFRPTICMIWPRN